MSIRVLIVLVFGLLATGGRVSTDSSGPQNPPPQTAAEAERQLASLRNARTNQNAYQRWTTDTRILALLVDRFPTRTAEITEAVDRIAVAPGRSSSTHLGILTDVYRQAFDKRLGLPAIERAVAQGLAALTHDEVAANRRAIEASGKHPPPTDASIDAEYIGARVQALTFLARVHVELDQMDPAEREFREIIAVHPGVTTAHLGLAEIAFEQHHDREALDHYLVASGLNAALTPAEVERMHGLYRKVHGSDAGFDDAMEAAYRAAIVNPITVEPYRRSEAPTGRVALVELFTGSGCFPCVAADLAFDALLERYPADLIAPLAYHLHAPEPDPMAIPAGLARLTRLAEASGVPRLFVDGAIGPIGGGNRVRGVAEYELYQRVVDQSLLAAPEATVAVSATRTGDRVNILTTVSRVAGDPNELRLRIVLAERELHYHGENGMHAHPMVVRAVAGADDAGLRLVMTGGIARVETTIDLAAIGPALSTALAANIASRRARENPAAAPRAYLAEGRAVTAIDPAALVVVAYVERSNRHVLQAARVDVRAAGKD